MSRIISVSDGDDIHPWSCVRRDRHGETRETSAEISRFTTLHRDEGYQRLELSSDNKLETSLLQSSAFFLCSKPASEKLLCTFRKPNDFHDGIQ
jgi:hypothetical protein